eukprot:scaffold6822_cov121-Skeletonema_dohrnii-CCMP3373.AAC.8
MRTAKWQVSSSGDAGSWGQPDLQSLSCRTAHTYHPNYKSSRLKSIERNNEPAYFYVCTHHSVPWSLKKFELAGYLERERAALS